MAGYSFKADGSTTQQAFKFYPKNSNGNVFTDETFSLSISGSGCGSLSNFIQGTDAQGVYFSANYTAPSAVPAAGVNCQFVATGNTSGDQCFCAFTLLDPDDCVDEICCPKIESITLGELVAGETLTGQIVATSDLGAVTFSQVQMPAGTAISASGVLSGTLPGAGQYSMQLSMTDGTATCGTTIVINVVDSADAPCPQPTAITLGALVTGEAMSGQVTATSDNGTVVFTPVSVPNGVTMDGAGVIGGVVPAIGSHTLVFAMDDGTRICNLSINFEVSDATTSSTACPAVTTVNLGALVAGQAINGSIVAASPTGDDVSYALKQAPSGVNIGDTDGVLSGTWPVAGDYLLVVTASDGTVTCDTTISFTVVEETACCPRLTEVSLQPMNAGESVSGTLQAESATGADVTFSATSLPSGMALSDTGVLTGTAPAQGTYATTVVLDDGETSCNTVLLLVVQPPLTSDGQCPVLQSIVIDELQAGQAINATFNATGNGAVTFSSTDLPAGLLLAANGVLGGNLANNATNLSFTLNMSDGSNNPCSVAINLPVQPVAVEPDTCCPKMASVFLPSAITGEQYTGLVVFNGEGSIRYSMTGQTGLSINPTTGQIGGNYNAAAGNTSETLTVTDDNGPCTFTLTFSAVNAVTSDAACPRLTSIPVMSATAGEPFSAQLSAIDGAGRATVAFDSLVLPDGMTLSSAGRLSGVPAVVGMRDIQVTLTDADDVSCNTTIAFEVREKPVSTEPSNCETLEAVYRSWLAKHGTPQSTLEDFMVWTCGAKLVDDTVSDDCVDAFEFWQQMHHPGGSCQQFLVWISKQPDCPKIEAVPFDYCIHLICDKEIHGVSYKATIQMPALLRVDQNTRDQLIANGEAMMAPH